MQIERCKNPLPLRWQGAYLMLLKKAGLHDEGDCEETVLAWDGETLLGCASLRGRVIKQIAVLPEAAGAGVAAALVSALVHRAAELERTHLFCYTKPEKQRLFRALGFFPLASTDWAVLLENRRDGVKTFLAGLPQADGCVVCNANPFTLGHLHLISEAARQCTRVLYLCFPPSSRCFRHRCVWRWCSVAAKQ
jgi:[citrate (pro-3S)-lyase] ligase